MKSLVLRKQNSTDMDIQAEKLHLIAQLAGLKDVNIIQKLKDIMQQENRISIEQYNKELDEADARIDAGDYYTQQEVEKMAKKW